jgi:ABC-type oligopeptide transport system substrate-binding subunit
MWRNELNIETEIIAKNWDEYEAALRAGDYDVVRRGIVMQTTDELTNMRMLFSVEPQTSTQAPQRSPAKSETEGSHNSGAAVNETRSSTQQPIETEGQALNQLKAIPVYFSSSYALVKPYVVGFDSNALDAPSLKRVQIDSNWKEPNTARASWSR